MLPQGTGWIPDLPDPRDYGPQHRNLAPVLAPTGLQKEIVAPPADLPARVDLRASFPPVFAQGPLNSCTAATAAALIGYFEKKALGRDVSPSVMFLYKIERNLLGKNGDTGAFLRTAMQALRAFGVPPDKAWPYRADLLDAEPAPFHYAYAANYKATHYFRLDDDGTSGDELLARARASLAGSIPMMFGLALFSSYSSAGPGEIPLPSGFDTKIALHALVAVGYDDGKTISTYDAMTGRTQITGGALRVRNSWGPEWGDGGYGWLPYDYVRSGLTQDWWCLLRADYLDIGDFGPGTAAHGGN
jgi:C1A family cysteine protease